LDPLRRGRRASSNAPRARIAEGLAFQVEPDDTETPAILSCRTAVSSKPGGSLTLLAAALRAE